MIGPGSYTLLDGSSIRTPGNGVWTVTGENMENCGAPPDVYINNTPADFVKGRDAQLEKGVDVLKADLAARRPSTLRHSGGSLRQARDGRDERTPNLLGAK